MDHLMDDAGSAIARRIRLEREARGWSLAELAQRSGVSKSAISKIERGETSPTAIVLVRLATAFDLTLAGLLIRAESDGSRLSRSADQPTWRDPATGYERRQVFARADHPIEMAEISLPAGQSVTLPASSYAAIRQIVRVTVGRLTIIEPTDRHELGPGDCLGFGPPSDVTFANETAAACSYVVVLVRR
ncbi:helix-turn-helix domain-containing protein [Consotaella aegiceratis]|uniref:helix-turn-helix domain-containing protein n=1 Tax=Consotaella aegiceratis TaxID=3097961 RepID=UPI002F40A73B